MPISADEEENLIAKWTREAVQERARLRGLSKEELLEELDAVGAGTEMVAEISDRLR